MYSVTCGPCIRTTTMATLSLLLFRAAKSVKLVTVWLQTDEMCRRAVSDARAMSLGNVTAELVSSLAT